MKKRIFAMMMAAVLGMSLLAACGGSSSADQKESVQTETAKQEETEKLTETQAPTEQVTETQAPTEQVTETEAAKSDEEQIADQVAVLGQKSFRNLIIAASMEELQKDEETMEIMKQAGVDAEEYVTAMADHCDLSFGNITVDGDIGAVDLLLTLPDFEKMDEFQNNKLNSWLEELDVSEMSEEEVYKAFGQIMMEIVKDPELPVSTESFTLDFTKKDGTWTMNDGQDLTQAIEEAFGVSNDE